MKFTDLFIRRPVIAVVVSLVIVIAGVQAMRTLIVRQYPRSENAVITVTTTYVGANAELVRGFITTPLERVIAAADGIDYIESESKQDVSIIRARLRLNYDANRALAEIGSKVDQVRGDLPADAEIPVLSIESADSQFASAYLSFSSDFLKQNEITDYLVRVVQPRLSAVKGVQRADIIGARTFAMRIWLKPDRMAALSVSPAEVRQALEANNYLAAVGQTKGSLVQVNLSADTDLRSVNEFQNLVVLRKGGAVVHLGEIADVVLGAEDYDSAVNFNGQTAPSSSGCGRSRTRTRSTSSSGSGPSQFPAARDPDGNASARVAFDATRTSGTPSRRCVHARGDAPHRRGRHFPLPGIVPFGAGAARGDPGLARGGGVPHAGVRVHGEPAHPPRHRALGGPRRRRRDRGGRERRAAPARGHEAGRRGCQRSA